MLTLLNIFFQDEEQTVTKCKLKETEEERARLVRTNAAQQTQIDKYKRLSEDARNKSDSLDTLLSGTKKVISQMRSFTLILHYCLLKAAFPLTRLGARRIALRRPHGRIKNRSNTITM